MTIDDLLRDHQSQHDSLQIEAWMLTQDNWTDWGRYKQCLRELHSRRAALRSIAREIELAEIDLDAARRPWCGWARIRRWELAREAQCERLDALRLSQSETLREFDQILETAVELKTRLGEITPERRKQLDVETWLARIKMHAAVELSATGRLPSAIVRMAAALPDDIRGRMLDVLYDKYECLRGLWHPPHGDVPKIA